MEVRQSPEEVKNHIHQCLQAYNSPFMSECRDFSFHIEDGGAIVAGVVAESVADTIEVSYLYVAEFRRHEGLGKLLLSELEENGRKAGIRRILLNTYSFQAPGFYEKCGYTRLFEISPCFSRWSQSFFIKIIG